MTMTPGSFIWLLAHDLRMNWRGFTGMFGSLSARRAILALVAAVVALHALAWPAARWIVTHIHNLDAVALPVIGIGGGMFTWMIAQSVFSATRTLFDRADLDLLLGSPLPASRVIAAKAIAIAVGTLGSIAVIALPVANMSAIQDSPSWLIAYPLLAALGLIATSFGLAIAMGLYLLFGPRRARLYAHLSGAGLGGTFVLGAQILAMLPSTLGSGPSAWLDVNSRALVPAALLNSSAIGFAAVCGLLAVGVVLFGATVRLLGERFATAAIAAAGAPSPNQRSSAGSPISLRFRYGTGRALRRKEWLLMRRDPSFFAQLSLQIIYTFPIAVVLMRSQMMPAAFAMVPTIVIIAGQVAGSIAWITVSGEDAPELIASAPVRPAAVDRIKLGAVALPVLAIIALPLLSLGLLSWRMAAIALVFGAGSALSTSLLNFRHPMPGNRRGMLRRHSQSKVIGLVEHGLAMLWAFAVVFALSGSVLFLLPVALAVLILAAMSLRRYRMPIWRTLRKSRRLRRPLPT